MANEMVNAHQFDETATTATGDKRTHRLSIQRLFDYRQFVKCLSKNLRHWKAIVSSVAVPITSDLAGYRAFWLQALGLYCAFWAVLFLLYCCFWLWMDQ